MLKDTKKLFLNSSVYFVGQGLVFFSGLITFPILTRLLTQSEYGLLCLVNVTLSLCVGIFRCGLDQAALRLFNDYKLNNKDNIFTSTIILTSIVLSLCGAVIIYFLSGRISIFLSHEALEYFLKLASILIFIRIVVYILNCFFRVKESPEKYIISEVSIKYISVFLCVIFIVLLSKGLVGYFYSMIIGEGLGLVILLIIYINNSPNFFKFSRKILKQSVMYGFPLTISGISALLLDQGDRYMIGALLDSSQVAIYSVGYTLCTYLKEFLVTPINFALIPFIMNLYANKKEEDIKSNIVMVIKCYFFLAFLIIVEVTLFGKELIIFLASEKYTDSSTVLPFIIIGTIVQGISFPLLVGLFFKKKTAEIALLTIAVAVINLLLNYLLIPSYGILGASYATLVSYILYLLFGTILSSKHFKISLPYLSLLKYLICAVVAGKIYTLMHIVSNNHFILLVYSSIIISFLYIMLMFSFDKEFRDYVFLFMKSFNKRSISR